MELGYIAIHRKLREHWIFKEKRQFSKFEAWIDILYEVNHQDNKFLLGNELIEIKRGSKITSLRKLSEKWQWSITKVKKFLILLEEDKMIDVKSDTKKTVLTVVNYNLYQSDEWKKRYEKDTENTREEHEKDTENTREETNKNDKNYNNDKEIYTDLENSNFSDCLKSSFKIWLDYKTQKKEKYKSFKSIQTIVNKIGKDFIDEQHMIDSINFSIEKKYSGIIPTKKRNNISEEIYKLYSEELKTGNKKISLDCIDIIIKKNNYNFEDLKEIMIEYYEDLKTKYANNKENMMKYAKEPQNFFSEKNGLWYQYDEIRNKNRMEVK